MDSHEKKLKWSDLRVGLLAMAAVVFLVMGIIFAGGDKGLLFRNTSMVQARLFDVGGLKKGSSVTMGGMIVGRVTEIEFVNDAGSKQIEVMMEVRRDVRKRIKADSVPAVRTQGMLGDRYIEISMGSDESGLLPEGQSLTGKSATDFDEAVRQATSVLEETEKLFVAINSKSGTVGQLVYDEQFYAHLMEITAALQDLLQDFKKQPKRYLKMSLF